VTSRGAPSDDANAATDVRRAQTVVIPPQNAKKAAPARAQSMAVLARYSSTDDDFALGVDGDQNEYAHGDAIMRETLEWQRKKDY
jgi:hypothetical protein